MKKYVGTLKRGMVGVFTMVLAVMLVLMLPSYAHAATGTGSISFRMKYGDKPVGGGELSISRIVDGKYNDSHKVTIASDGRATLSGLEPGVYHVEQTKAASGYTKISPFNIRVVSGQTSNAEPKMAVIPDDPSSPDEPDNPDTPDEPDKPDNPNTPDQPDNPNTPDEPDQPDNPNTPDEPDQPDNPNTPDEPDQPDNPNTPDEPDQPDNPKTPDEPDNPDTPDNPDEPDKTGKPKLPQTGQLWWPVWLLSGAGIALIIAGLFVHMKRSRE